MMILLLLLLLHGKGTMMLSLGMEMMIFLLLMLMLMLMMLMLMMLGWMAEMRDEPQPKGGNQRSSAVQVRRMMKLRRRIDWCDRRGCCGRAPENLFQE